MKAVIITDGTELIQSTALLIKESLNGYKVNICCAEGFEGTELLPSDVFFIGCESPSPKSFSWLEDLLSHINLASRKCGIFSAKVKSIKYLRTILKSCEADISELEIDENGKVKKSDIKKLFKEMKI